VRQQGLEGIVAKRKASSDRSGDRSGDWVKLRVNRGQEFVIGGYVPNGSNFDSILIGYYDGKHLMYSARIRAGFVTALRHRVFAQFDGMTVPKCPFNQSARPHQRPMERKADRRSHGEVHMAEASPCCRHRILGIAENRLPIRNL
jgi:ATP-dependent DNA ligase